MGHQLAHESAHFAQHDIAGIVAMVVVEPLEMVDVERKPATRRTPFGPPRFISLRAASRNHRRFHRPVSGSRTDWVKQFLPQLDIGDGKG